MEKDHCAQPAEEAVWPGQQRGCRHDPRRVPVCVRPLGKVAGEGGGGGLSAVPRYHLVNYNLPSDYIPNLQNDYPPALLAAYLNGEFVNLTSGSVYPEFKRSLNSTKEVERAGEHLHIGMDFNVYKWPPWCS